LILSDDHTHDQASGPANSLSVGGQLRSAREARGLTLEDICRETRVVRDYLIAVEEGDFDRLPSKAYVRGIIRSYAGCVGISADGLISLYDGVTETPKKGRNLHGDPDPDARQRVKRWEKGWWIVPLALLGILIMTTLLFRDNEPDTGRRETSVMRPSTVAPLPVLQLHSSARREPDRVSEPGPAPVTNPDPRPEQTSPGIYLKLKAERDSGLTITIDGALTQRYDLKSGDLIEWKGERSISVDIDSPEAIVAEFNGKPLSLSGGSDGPVHLDLRPDTIP
jgi:transcriptional regulator with XRE-family HTH domain